MTREDVSRDGLEPGTPRKRRRDEPPPNPTAGVDPALVATVRAAVLAHAAHRGPLLPVLHALQAELGYLPADVTTVLAAELNLSRAEVHGVISFYTDFRREPAAGPVVRICRAEACQAVGAEALYTAARAAGHDVEQVFCLGNCALGPSAQVGDRLLGRVTLDRLREVSAEGASALGPDPAAGTGATQRPGRAAGGGAGARGAAEPAVIA
jgi:formate dehydrogenase subunit gamma